MPLLTQAVLKVPAGYSFIPQAEGDRLMSHDQVGQSRRDLGADALAASGLVHAEATTVDDLTGGVADDELEFGAADLDAKESHAARFGLSPASCQWRICGA